MARHACRLIIAIAWSAGCADNNDPPPTATPVVVTETKLVDANTIDAASQPSPIAHAGPPVSSDASIDGAALRAAHRSRLIGDRSPVTMVTGGTARELGLRLCRAVVPKRAPATPILLKPNMSGFNWFRDPAKSGGDDGVTGRITDPAFVGGVIDCLRERGHTKITVGDGFTGKAADWDRLTRVSGYQALADHYAIPLVAFDDDGVFDKRGDTPGKPLVVRGIERTTVPTLMIPKIVADHLARGMVISLPKIKAHRFAVFSLAIKGMQGLVMYSDATPAFHQKWRSHRELAGALAALKQGDGKSTDEGRAKYVAALERFAERMVDVLEIETPDAVLAEGAPAMHGDGFTELIPIEDHVAIGGTNPIWVDRVGAEFLGLWNNQALARELGGHATSPLLDAAAKRYRLDLARVEVIGDGARLLATPRPARLTTMAGFALDG